MPETLRELFTLLFALGDVLLGLLAWLFGLLLSRSLLLAWLAWWLWGVNWKKVWPVLAQGAWVPVILVIIATALAWSQMAPSTCVSLGFPVPNFWWQLGAVSLVVLATLFVGWLQGALGWTPSEISLEPPEPVAHGHAHH